MSSSTVAYLVQNPAKPPFAGAQILYTIYSSVLSIGVDKRHLGFDLAAVLYMIMSFIQFVYLRGAQE